MARRPHLRPQRLLDRAGDPGDLPGCGAASTRGLSRLGTRARRCSSTSFESLRRLRPRALPRYWLAERAATEHTRRAARSVVVPVGGLMCSDARRVRAATGGTGSVRSMFDCRSGSHRELGAQRSRSRAVQDPWGPLTSTGGLAPRAVSAAIRSTGASTSRAPASSATAITSCAGSSGLTGSGIAPCCMTSAKAAAKSGPSGNKISIRSRGARRAQLARRRLQLPGRGRHSSVSGWLKCFRGSGGVEVLGLVATVLLLGVPAIG
jgi:hypothetical protein